MEEALHHPKRCSPREGGDFGDIDGVYNTVPVQHYNVMGSTTAQSAQSPSALRNAGADTLTIARDHGSQARRLRAVAAEQEAVDR